MKYEYKLVTARDKNEVDSINLDYLDRGWEVVSSVSQHMGGTGWGGTPQGGLMIFTLRRQLPD